MLEIRGTSRDDAFAFVHRHHRHHDPPLGWLCGFSCWNLSVDGDGSLWPGEGTLVGVATLGRPVARALQERGWIEVTRLCTIESELAKNAASMLLGRCAREAKRRGAPVICTYTLASESGGSLIAAGWAQAAKVRGRSWSCQSRPRTDRHPTVDKIRWERRLRKEL